MLKSCIMPTLCSDNYLAYKMIRYCNAFVLDKIDGTFATRDYNSSSTGRCGNAATSARDATLSISHFVHSRATIQ